MPAPASASASSAASAPAWDADPAELLERVAGCEAPLLVGVRHHSPACAAALPGLLDAFAPERLFVELPADLAPWLPWLGHPELVAPVAVAAAGEDGDRLSFYPFADFSPELAAIRWAARRGVPVEAFDRPTTEREPRAAARPEAPGPAARALLPAFCAAGGADDGEALWDRLVEARAPGAAPEQVRRAALLFGLALRLDAAAGAGVAAEDLRREGFMRSRLAAARGVRAVAVVGAFHAAALLPAPLLWSAPEAAAREPGGRAATVGSLVPYAFDLLDSRSGYPAGIRDPLWQQRTLEALRAGRPLAEVAAEVAVEACRALREAGHVAGVPDAHEVARLAADLARLRGLPGPGRREVLEAVTSALGQGELLGRGRAVARALEKVLVGSRRGQLPPGSPRSGLGPHLDARLAALRLPPRSAARDPVDLRLDPLRSDLDRRRHVALERLVACGVPYGARQEVAGLGGADALGAAWRIQPTPSTDAMVELAGLWGVTLGQAADGALRRARQRLAAEERLGARARLELLERAAACGLAAQAREGLAELMGPFLREAGLPELLAAAALVERIARGHVPALPPEAVPPDLPAFALPAEVGTGPLVAAAVRALEGLGGSTRPEDVQALAELVRWHDAPREGEFTFGDGRLGAAVDRLAAEGSPLMQGAGTGCRVLLGRAPSSAAGETAGSWVDAAATAEARGALSGRLQGLLLVCGPRLESDPGLLDGLLARVEALSDEGFLARVAALRDGFDALSPASRQRLLEVLSERHGVDPRTLRARVERQGRPPRELALLAEADRKASAALAALGLSPAPPDLTAAPSGLPAPSAPGLTPAPPDLAPGAAASSGASPAATPASGAAALPPGAAAEGAPATPAPLALAALDRWRLILGRERERVAPGLRPVARALDELYGRGHGEGAAGLLGSGGGQETPFPSVREWSEELDALFGARVREEVLGRAAARGRAAAALELSPDGVRPSVELLEQVLSLRGGLPEAQLGRLRRLVSRIVDGLVRELAVRIRPALTGLATPRPTRRPGGPLDLRRTIARNLRTARLAGGAPVVVPEAPIFRTRARRSLDWRIILAVDVSGSMEPSVIYAAVMAAILAGLPAVQVHFLAFSTEVIDLSARVADPLGLLLEVAVGGGTHIAQALRYARQLVTVPARTLLLTVSDFEEGFAVEALVAEVRGLVEAGVKALGLAALDDAGKARYDAAVAEQLVAAGMPVAALTPLELAAWVGEQVR